MQFSGVGGITIPSHDELHLSSSDFTMAFWLKADDMPDGKAEVVLDKFGPQNLDYMVLRARDRLTVRFSGKNASLVVPDGIRPGRWTHIAIRQNVRACRLTLFVDGCELLSTMLHATPKKSDAPLRLGHSGVARQAGFHGALDDLYVYRRALSNKEIATLGL